MRHEDVYELSKRHSPPKIDLLGADTLYRYGRERQGSHPISHIVPEDVTREDFDHYPYVFAFMEFEDLLFYLYPICLEYERDIEIDCIDSFMYSLDPFVPESHLKLSQADQNAVISGLSWIWNSSPLGYADWIQCPNLQAAIGVCVSWDDID